MTDGKRMLKAVLVADVSGYSRLMANDEQATVATLNDCRRVFDELTGAHHGRIVDMAGDSVLAVFDSVVEAVECAVAAQAAISRRNAELSEARRMWFRIGINLGDILQQNDGTVYGDGVNVAARLQALAAPGGVMLSADARRHVGNRLQVRFENAGTHAAKNIAEPVQAHRVVLGEPEAAPRPAETPLALPDKPSIAVLPFDNLSGDRDQEYLADGVVEDLITGLSRLRWLFVISRNSSFTYKGRAVNLKEAGRELGVRYIVEGSVRRGGERLRVTVQLVDAAAGNHIWAERYDRNLIDIFALQDEITEAITAALETELGQAERERARRKPPDSLDAWEALQKGFWHIYQFTPEDSLAARNMLRSAIADASDFAPLCSALAYAQFLAHVLDYPDTDLDEALCMARRSVDLDDRDAMSHFALGRILTLHGEVDTAVDELMTAIDLNPSFALAQYALGYCKVIQGRNAEAVRVVTRAIRLSPRDPAMWAMESVRAVAYAAKGDLEAALTDARNATRRPHAPVAGPIGNYNILASILGLLERKEEARPVVDLIRCRNPNFSPERVLRQFGFTDLSLCSWYVEGLEKVGIPFTGWSE